MDQKIESPVRLIGGRASAPEPAGELVCVENRDPRRNIV
jgi:hypothetical protein